MEKFIMNPIQFDIANKIDIGCQFDFMSDIIKNVNTRKKKLVSNELLIHFGIEDLSIVTNVLQEYSKIEYYYAYFGTKKEKLILVIYPIECKIDNPLRFRFDYRTFEK